MSEALLRQLVSELAALREQNHYLISKFARLEHDIQRVLARETSR